MGWIVHVAQNLARRDRGATHCTATRCPVGVAGRLGADPEAGPIADRRFDGPDEPAPKP